MSYRFAVSPNEVDITISDITVSEKKGWNYLWVLYRESDDAAAKQTIQKPVAAYVEGVYVIGVPVCYVDNEFAPREFASPNVNDWLLKDAPRRYGGFTPENYDQLFMGPIFARDALIASRNVPAVSLQSRLEHPGLYDFLQSAGVAGLKDEGHYGLALCLGGAELTMEELLRLYAILPNGGLLKPIRKLRAGSDEGRPRVSGIPGSVHCVPSRGVPWQVEG